MIPKKIHCCWLGGGKYPDPVRHCLQSWRKALRGYEIVLWDEKRFDVNSVPWVREAIEHKKYAFAADYIRHYALYREGGIYLDTDVEVLRPFDDLLDAQMFAVVETDAAILARNIAQGNISETGEVLVEGPLSDSGLGMQSGVFGAVAGHPFSKRCLDWYETHHFVQPDGSLYDKIIAPDIMAYNAVPAGFRYKDMAQELDEGIRIYASDRIAANDGLATPESYAIHHCLGSWRMDGVPVKKRKKWYSRWWKSAMRGLGLHK